MSKEGWSLKVDFFGYHVEYIGSWEFCKALLCKDIELYGSPVALKMVKIKTNK